MSNHYELTKVVPRAGPRAFIPSEVLDRVRTVFMEKGFAVHLVVRASPPPRVLNVRASTPVRDKSTLPRSLRFYGARSVEGHPPRKKKTPGGETPPPPPRKTQKTKRKNPPPHPNKKKEKENKNTNPSGYPGWTRHDRARLGNVYQAVDRTLHRRRRTFRSS